jgi:hypothetical protein
VKQLHCGSCRGACGEVDRSCRQVRVVLLLLAFAVPSDGWFAGGGSRVRAFWSVVLVGRLSSDGGAPGPSPRIYGASTNDTCALRLNLGAFWPHFLATKLFSADELLPQNQDQKLTFSPWFAQCRDLEGPLPFRISTCALSRDHPPNRWFRHCLEMRR